MNKYMKADLYRIRTRIPRYIVLVIMMALMGLILFFVSKEQTIYQMTDMLTKAITYACPLLGLVEYLFVYGDDFKAKTMQIAIGTGVKRRHVVLAKWLEVIILCVIDYVILFAIILFVCLLRGIQLDAGPVVDILILLLFGLVKTTACIGVTMILVFATQGTALGMLLYLAEMTGIVNTIFKLVFSFKHIEKLRLDRFLLTNLENIACSRMIVGTFSVGHVLGIIIYFAAFYIIATHVFKRKELEF